MLGQCERSCQRCLFLCATRPRPRLALLVACGPEPSDLGGKWEKNEVVAGLGAAASGPNRNDHGSARSRRATAAHRSFTSSWERGNLVSAWQRAGAPASTRLGMVCAMLGNQQTEECVGMDFVYHGSRHRCRFGLGAHRVVPAALGGGRVSQSAQNGMRHGAAAVTERARTVSLIRSAGDCGGAPTAVAYG